jgi:protease I
LQELVRTFDQQTNTFAMAKHLEGIHVAIVATDGFEQVELTDPRKALEDAGAKTHVIAPESGTIRGWDHKDWGIDVDVDRTFKDASADDYDALFLPGGVLNPDQLRMNEQAVSFVRHFFENSKPVGSICHGPQTLINAGVVKGRRMTSYASIQKDLENAGANWVDQEVVVDNGLITSRNPDDIPAFNEAIINEFSFARSKASV